MAAATKSYGVRFYCGVSKSSSGSATPVSQLLETIASSVTNGSLAPQYKVGEERYELRDIKSHNHGAVIQGVLAVLRDDAPHIREANGGEKPIPLSIGDTILEKNHFIYYRTNELLVWQVNGRASHISRFEKYMTCCAKSAVVVFDDVLSVDALKRLESGTVTRLEFRVAQPRNAELIDPSNWERGAFEMMSGADASLISVKVSTRRKAKGLSEALKSVVHRLLAADTTRKIEVKLRSVTDPIDLMTECLKGNITVDMDGLYPITQQVFHELDVTKSGVQPLLDAYFGVGDATLD